MFFPNSRASDGLSDLDLPERIGPEWVSRSVVMVSGVVGMDSERHSKLICGI